MAGIGFELKRLFDRRTLTGQTMAYGYSAIITAGPFALLTSMVLLIQLLFLHGIVSGYFFRSQPVIFFIIPFNIHMGSPGIHNSGLGL